MWPFRNRKRSTAIEAGSVDIVDGVAVIDVRGQTCPGYLLAINKAVDRLPDGMRARLLITYPPCGEDVQAWCKERGIQYLGLEQHDGMWVIRIRKPDSPQAGTAGPQHPGRRPVSRNTS